MSEIYGEAHRALQDAFDSRKLADALEDRVLRSALTEMDRRFVAARKMFFLTSVDYNGYPTVSYKGGGPGFVRILDDRTIAFPIYDGNGMFYSMGNIRAHSKVGLLFIDFETPRRLRMHGRATIAEGDPLISDYKEARLIVRVALETIFTNCARYIHRADHLEISKYVPKEGSETPIPEWKHVDYLNEALPEADRTRVNSEGEVITEEAYRKDFWRGL